MTYPIFMKYSGRKKDKNYLEQQLSQREKLLKADMKAQGRPKSTIYAIGANLIGAGANKVRRWETMINRPKTNDEGNKSEVNEVHFELHTLNYLRVMPWTGTENS